MENQNQKTTREEMWVLRKKINVEIETAMRQVLETGDVFSSDLYMRTFDDGCVLCAARVEYINGERSHSAYVDCYSSTSFEENKWKVDYFLSQVVNLIHYVEDLKKNNQ